MPIIQHLGTAYASGGGAAADPVLGNLEVWCDPTLFTPNGSGVIATNTDHNFNASSNQTGTFRMMNADAQFDSSVAGNHAIEGVNPAETMCAMTYNQNNLGMTGLTNYSFQGWVYVGNQSNGSWCFLLGKSGFWGSATAGIFINSDAVNWGFHTGPNGSNFIDIAPNGWHNIAGVRNLAESNSRRFFVDGVLAASDDLERSNNNANLSNNNPLSILCHGANNTTAQYPVGRNWGFGHCLFYSDALSDAEVLYNYNQHKALYGL